MKIIQGLVISIIFSLLCVATSAQAQINNMEVRDASVDLREAAPASYEDVLILTRAIALLNSQSAWNREGDMACDDDERNGVRSLYCALKKSSSEVLGEYNDGRVALQELRAVILERTNSSNLTNSLKEYNNSAATTWSDVISVLEASRSRVERHLREHTNPGRPDVRDL